MKKIFIIVNGPVRPDPGIIALLREHFPELGIEIVRREEENPEGLRFNPDGTEWGEFCRNVVW